MGWESCGVVEFDLGPLLQGEMGNLISKLNFDKLTSYLVDNKIPTLPAPHFPSSKGRQQKEEVRMRALAVGMVGATRPPGE